MEINPNFLAPCGLYCGVCGVYYATRDKNLKFLEKLFAFYKTHLFLLIKLFSQKKVCKNFPKSGN
ncbi:DUF3795 domain-containing protein [Thermodesulfobacteriota bacterium]